MASTNNLLATEKWAAPLLRFTPQDTGALEPILTNANLVKQTILGAPFIWRWNRNTVTLPLSSGSQDYEAALYDFGFMETASLLSASAGGVSFKLDLAPSLGISTQKSRPASVCTFGDDNAGNLLFRFNSTPETTYTARLDYQRKPVPMTSLASLWAPIPDELAYIYNWGYLAMATMATDDARFPVFNQRFIAHLLGAQDAISDLARNVFLANWANVQSQAQRAQAQTAQATAVRSAY